jgi:L-fuconolactonase
MSTLPIVDSHVHLWDLDRMSYPWLEDLPSIHETHRLEEYDAAIGDAPVEALVFVECTVSFDNQMSRQEVQWVSSLAERDERIQGIVAHASLEDGRAGRDHLEWLAQQPLVTGVRRILQAESDEFLQRPRFIEGVQMLAEFDFTFDLTVQAPQLPSVLELVDACPDVTFVLDHIGKPNIEEGAFEPWSTNLAALAERPNVVCKLSGVLTEADPEDWTTQEIRPYVDHAIKQFGFDRLMFGGDWPVLRLAADYRTWLAVLTDALSRYTEEEKRRLFQDTAERVYRLK